MRTPNRLPLAKLLTAVIGASLLHACGSEGQSVATPLSAAVVIADPKPATPPPVVTPPVVTPPVVTPPLVKPPVVQPTPPVVSDPAPKPPGAAPTPPAGALTAITVDSHAASEQLAVPLTFGQVFVKGQFAPEKSLVGKLPDGSTLPLQVDVKARHADGSVRHAIISGVVPKLAAGASTVIGLALGNTSPANTAVSPEKLLAAGFSAAAKISLAGVGYTASADALLRSGRYTHWLAGPTVNEWHVSAPLTSASGQAHPHLTARFAIRTYASNKTRVDVTIENNWAYEAAPQNFVYDAVLTVGGQQVYAKPAMTHYHHARWRKLFWWGAAPQLHVKHNTGYLIATKALPNYDQSVVIPESMLNTYQTNWSGAKTEPMGVGVANPYMPTTGGRGDIGLLPSWAVTYLLSMDKRIKDITLATADLSGSWSSHFRDKNTDRPVSLVNYPSMTQLGTPGDTYNRTLKRSEAFPTCATPTGCTKVNTHDTSHQPGFAYLPYLVTGDYYYLEELQFWAMFNTFVDNPGYRDFGKGLFKPDQVRGQAWSMRTLAQAAYITPDADTLKGQFQTFLSNNLDWYNSNYTHNASANKLGIITNGYAVVYAGNTGLAPWMDDFFTSAIGYAAELGFDQAKPLLAYKAKFPVARMTTPGTCWIDAGIYALTVRDSGTSPFYETYKQAYDKSHNSSFLGLACASQAMASVLKLKVGEMPGYSGATIGYPSNLQPALAYAASNNLPGAQAAWDQFMARSVKPAYGTGPQFAIVPR